MGVWDDTRSYILENKLKSIGERALWPAASSLRGAVHASQTRNLLCSCTAASLTELTWKTRGRKLRALIFIMLSCYRHSVGVGSGCLARLSVVAPHPKLPEGHSQPSLRPGSWLEYDAD